MGQASSSPIKLSFFKKTTENKYEDISNKFTKATVSTLAVPMIIIAYPVLNAYTFQDSDITGVRIIDGAIGGILGVIGWPLAPIMAIWGAIQINFKDKPSLPLSISPELLEAAKQNIDLDTELYYNVAVIGCSGTGKSSIVNAIRGYKDTHRNASKVGEIETTDGPLPYPHPDLPTMMIWDMPGVGTKSHPRETYFEKNYLGTFDLLVIVLGNRLMQDDIDIAVQAKEHKIPILFVRSKADQAIDSKIKRKGTESDTYEWASAVGELVKEVRESVFSQLRQEQLNTRKLFIISAETLQVFVATINKQEKRDHINSIDEQRFIRALVEGVFAKRRLLEKQNKKKAKEKGLLKE